MDHSQVTEDGRTSEFLDLERDESKLALLFEKFVLNFYAREEPRYQKGSTDLKWSFEEIGDSNLMPGMRTDVPLESNDRIVIIDTK